MIYQKSKIIIGCNCKADCPEMLKIKLSFRFLVHKDILGPFAIAG
jgi:hypothetical protein